MPVFICPNCRERSVDLDGVEGFSRQAPQCRSCGFGFLFQLLEDYYPAPSTGFVVCDADARVLAVGRGVFELTGFREADLIGRDVGSALALSDTAPLELVREWGVRRLGEQLELRTRGGADEARRRRPLPRVRRRRGRARRALVALTASRGRLALARPARRDGVESRSAPHVRHGRAAHAAGSRRRRRWGHGSSVVSSPSC